MKELSKDGNVQPHRKADIISVNDENLMWDLNVLGSGTPKQLVDTVLYLLRVHFALRATVEHHALRVGPKSQLTLGLDRDHRYLEYHEDVSKTCQGGIDHRNVGRKKVRAYANIAEPERCVVALYEKYLAHRPVHMNLDDFYLRPLANVKGSTWYACQPIGRNMLSKVVTNLATQAGLKGNYSNHSLRATAATQLYNANVDKQLISEVTGHRSNVVRGYKRTSNDQLKSVSNVLYGHDFSGKLTDMKPKCEEKMSKMEVGESDDGEASCKKRKVDVNMSSDQEKLPVNVNVMVNINK